MQTYKPPAANAGQLQEQCSAAGIRQSNMASYLDGQFRLDAGKFRDGGRLRSGYDNLDALTTLYPGLYVIGAISSLGKTTFMHQMCDQIAESGTHALFFSLEQSTLDLASKSISRCIARRADGDGGSQEILSSLQIRQSDLSDPSITAAIRSYRAYADKLTVIECSFRATINDIEKTVHEYIRQNHVKPVVVIDYLQVIQTPEGSGMTAKDAVDCHVRRLKALQSDCQLTMIVVSSINRQNYMTSIDFESFKESGGIEYTADVVWGLQFQCIHHDIFSRQNKVNEKREMIQKARRELPRKVELVCLKNRFGVSSYSCRFDYYSNCDWFKPDFTRMGLGAVNEASAGSGRFTDIPPELQCRLPY